MEFLMRQDGRSQVRRGSAGNARSALPHDRALRGRKVRFLTRLLRAHTFVCVQEVKAEEQEAKQVMRAQLRNGTWLASGGDGLSGGVGIFVRSDFLPNSEVCHKEIIPGRAHEVRLKKNDFYITIINIHAHDLSHQRLGQLKQHCEERDTEHRNNPTKFRVIMMGDLNTTADEVPTNPMQRTIKHITAKGIELDLAQDTHYHLPTKKYKQIDRVRSGVPAAPAHR